MVNSVPIPVGKADILKVLKLGGKGSLILDAKDEVLEVLQVALKSGEGSTTDASQTVADRKHKKSTISL